jgi:hypothetical protein
MSVYLATLEDNDRIISKNNDERTKRINVVHVKDKTKKRANLMTRQQVA